jgi:hypothetical protein
MLAELGKVSLKDLSVRAFGGEGVVVTSALVSHVGRKHREVLSFLGVAKKPFLICFARYW